MAGSEFEQAKAEELLEGVARDEDVAGVAGERQALAESFDVAGGDGAEGVEKRLIAGLQSKAGMQTRGVAGVGGLSAQATVEFDLEAKELLQRGHGRSLRDGRKSVRTGKQYTHGHIAGKVGAGRRASCGFTRGGFAGSSPGASRGHRGLRGVKPCFRFMVGLTLAKLRVWQDPCGSNFPARSTT